MKTKIVQVRLDEENIQKLKEKATFKGLKLGTYLRFLILNFLENEKEK